MDLLERKRMHINANMAFRFTKGGLTHIQCFNSNIPDNKSPNARRTSIHDCVVDNLYALRPACAVAIVAVCVVVL